MHFFSPATLGVLLLSSHLITCFPTFFKGEPINEAALPEALRGPGLLNVTKYPRISDKVKGMVRGPCPFINTAANHGILPYNGRRVTPDMINRLISKVGMGETLGKGLAFLVKIIIKDAVKRNSNHVIDSFNLNDMNVPRLIEHDASLVRWDMLEEGAVPKQVPPSKELVEGLIQTAKDMSGDKHKGPVYLTASSIAAWRKKRVDMESKRPMPSQPSVMHKSNYGIKAKGSGAGEAAALTYVLGDNGYVREDVIRSILLEETFPQGWVAHKVKGFGMIMEIGKALAGYHAPDFALKWFHSWTSPSEADLATVDAATEIENSSYAQRVLKTWSWSLGDKEACPECEAQSTKE